MAQRVLVIGLDCAPPKLVFHDYRHVMPHLSGLMDRGSWAPLHSTVPPITVPAWTSMLSGRDPGELGLYGFRNRKPGSYALTMSDASDVHHDRVWDWAGRAGKRSCVLFVPPTYPPPPIEGELVSCFLTPDVEVEHTYPDALADELEARFGDYQIDVADFRGHDLDRILADLKTMTAQHFAMAAHLWQSRKPDLMVMVEMGLDRFHHAFWQHIDPDHPRHEPGNAHQDSGLEYYRFVDDQLGKLLSVVADDTAVLVVSDHGARAMQGGICLNEWLIEQGDLVLNEYPEELTAPQDLSIDWTKTRAWSEGGYYARVFLNVKGREPHGVIEAQDRGAAATELADRIAAIPGPDGQPLNHRIERPEHCYRAQTGLPPDLSVFLGDLDYRAVGSVGTRQVYTAVNDTGPDGCNHDWHGIFIMAGGQTPARGQLAPFAIYDVAATVSSLLGVGYPAGLLGVDRSAP